MSNSAFFAAHGLNVQNTFIVNTTALSFGSNLIIDSSGITIGNSSVNLFSNSSSIILGNTAVNTTAILLGSNVFLNTTELFVGNSTVNLVANSIILKLANSSGFVTINPISLAVDVVGINTTALFAGSNVILNQSTLSIGNSSVNSVVISTQIKVANSSGSANLEPTLLRIGTSLVNATSVNTSFIQTTLSNTTGNAQFHNIGIGTPASGIQGRVLAAENLISFFSDKRLKEEIRNIENALGKVKKLGGYKFFLNDIAESFGFTDITQQVGILAQEVQTILPEAVCLAPFDTDENGDSKSGNYYLTVQNEKLIPLLIEAIKELDGKLDNFMKDKICQ